MDQVSSNLFLGSLQFFKSYLVNLIIASASKVIPYTGLSTPVPQDAVDAFRSDSILYSMLFLAVAAANFVTASIANLCSSYGAEVLLPDFIKST